MPMLNVFLDTKSRVRVMEGSGGCQKLYGIILGAGKCGSPVREVSCNLNVQVLSPVESETVVLWVLMTAYISR